MGIDDHHKKMPSKRDLPEGEMVDVPEKKKVKMDPEVEKDAYLKEIETLNQRLKESELEIESLREQLRKKDLQVDDSKEIKVDHEIEKDAHLKEIEALNQRLKESEAEIESSREQLRKKDFEITALHKMVANIQKRQKPIK